MSISVEHDDAAMQDKIAQFLDGNKYNDVDDASVGDDGGDIGLKPLDIPHSLDDNHLDSIILGCNNLDDGISTFESMTGLKCGIQTTLRGGAGTKSSCVKLSDNIYVEIMGPDPKNGGMDCMNLSSIPNGKLVPYGYTVRVDDHTNLPGNIPENWQRDEIMMIGHGSPTQYDEELDVYKWDMVRVT